MFPRRTAPTTLEGHSVMIHNSERLGCLRLEFSFNPENHVYFLFDHSSANDAPHRLSTSFGCAVKHEGITFYSLSLDSCQHLLSSH